MRQFRRIAWLRPRRSLPLLVTAVSTLSFLVPATLGPAGSALASPAAGYTASLIPTGQASATVAVNPVTDTEYFGAVNTGKVVVVDGGTNTVTATIGLGDFPTGIAVNSVTDTVYVSLPTSPPAVAVIDGTTNAVTATITLPSGAGSGGVAVDSATNTIYVSEPGVPGVAVIDGSTNQVTATVGTGTGTLPTALAVDEATDVVWVADLNGRVLAISGATSTVTQTVDVSVGTGNVYSVAVNPINDTVYAAVQDGGVAVGGAAVINGATGTVTTMISIQALDWVAVDPDSGTVFASSYAATNGSPSGTTWVIDASSNAIVDTIERGGVDVAVDSATGSAYIAPSYAQGTGSWVLTPSASNAMSPVIVSTGGVLTEGAAGSFTINGSAIPAATYTEAGALPAGVTLSPSGVLSGTPAPGTAGTYPVVLTASNGIAPDYSQPFTLTVAQLPAITGPASTTFQVGTAVSEPLQVTGFPAPDAGAYYLPAGLAVVRTTAGLWELTGIPSAGSGGAYNVEFYATNAAGTATTTVPITVQEAPSVTSAPTATFLAGVAGNFTVTTTGYPAPVFSESGSLPAGITFSAGGVLAGTPAAGTAGSYPIQITATNASGTATQAFTLVVDSPTAPVITSADQMTFDTGIAGSFTVTATGSPAPALSESGALPAGITFSAGGVLAGTPAAGTAGSYPIQITATSAGGTTTQTFALTVNPPATTAPAVLTDPSGEVMAYTVRDDGNIWDYVDTGVSTVAQQLTTAGDFTGTPAVVETSSGNIGIYARTTSGTIMGASQAGPGGPVTAFSPIGTASDLVSDPTVLLTSSGVIAIYGSDSAGSIEGISQSAPNSAFGNWQVLSPDKGFSGRPAVIQTSSGVIAIYARTPAGTVLGASQSVPGGAFSSWGRIGPVTDLVSDPTVLLTSSGVIAIYGSDSGGAVEGISQSAPYSAFGNWQVLSPDKGFSGRPAVIQTSSGVIAIYARTPAGTILGASQSVPGGAFSSWGQIGSASDLVSDPDALIMSTSHVIAIYAADSSGGTSWISQSVAYGPFGTWGPL